MLTIISFLTLFRCCSLYLNVLTVWGRLEVILIPVYIGSKVIRLSRPSIFSNDYRYRRVKRSSNALRRAIPVDRFHCHARRSSNVVLSLGSFSGQLLSHVHGPSYKQGLPVCTRKLIFGYQQYRRVGMH